MPRRSPCLTVRRSIGWRPHSGQAGAASDMRPLVSVHDCSVAIMPGTRERGILMPAPTTAAKAATKPEDGWRQARLIPTTGIGGQDEQEQRATSSLLAVMAAVPQFGRAILDLVGAPGGRI